MIKLSNQTDVPILGPIYIERQSQCYNNSVMMLTIMFSLKTIVTLEWGCNPFSNDSIVFNGNSIAVVITELSQH